MKPEKTALQSARSSFLISAGNTAVALVNGGLFWMSSEAGTTLPLVTSICGIANAAMAVHTFGRGLVDVARHIKPEEITAEKTIPASAGIAVPKPAAP